TDPPVDSAYGFDVNSDFTNWAERNFKPAEYRTLIAKGEVPIVYFWYRQSPRTLEPLAPNTVATRSDPSPTLSNMAEVTLTLQGKLRSFNAVPEQADTGPASSEVDWTNALKAGGLYPLPLTDVQPREIPLVSFDQRRAWEFTNVRPPAPPL